MIHKPPIDELVEKIGSKYSLCVVASKRARQLMDISQNQGVEFPDKPLSTAAQEIYDGKLIATKGKIDINDLKWDYLEGKQYLRAPMQAE